MPTIMWAQRSTRFSHSATIGDIHILSYRLAGQGLKTVNRPRAVIL